MTVPGVNNPQIYIAQAGACTQSDDAKAKQEETIDFGSGGEVASEDNVELSDEAKAKQEELEAKKKEEEEKKKLHEEIQKLNKEISKLNAKLQDMKEGSDKEELAKQIAQLESNIQDLQSQLNGTDKNKGTSSVPGQVASLNPTDEKEQYLENYKQGKIADLQSHAPSASYSAPSSKGVSYPTSNPFGGLCQSQRAASPASYQPTSSANTQTQASDSVQTVQMPVTKNISSDVAQGLDAKLGTGFSAKVEQVAANINCNPNDLLAMMYSESGINPKAGNGIGATGLIQFLPQTAKDLGTTTSALKNMSAVEQMDYVEKFFMKNKKMFLGSSNAQLDAGTMYALCFLPASAKSEVLCASGGKYSWAYKANSGLDMDKSGTITKTDLNNRLAKKYKEMYSQFA